MAASSCALATSSSANVSATRSRSQPSSTPRARSASRAPSWCTWTVETRMPRVGSGALGSVTATNTPPSRTASSAGSEIWAASTRPSAPSGISAAYGARQIGAAGDEVARASSPHVGLVLGARHRDDAEPAVGRDADEVVAEPAGRAGDDHRRALVEAEQVECLVGGQRVEREAGREHRVDTRRCRRDGGGRQDHVAGIGAGRPGERVAQADHSVSDGEVVHVGADRVDDAGDIPAEPERERLPDDRPEGSGAQSEVDGVDARGGDGDPDLTRLWVRRGHVDDLQDLGSAVLLGDDCSHGLLLDVVVYLTQAYGELLSIGK